MNQLCIRILFTASFIVCVLSCSKDNKKPQDTDVSQSVINIGMRMDSYDSLCPKFHISFIMLKENDETMFIDIDKVRFFNGNYYILDRSSARKLVSFTSDGSPVGSYGRQGDGPGEYVFPWDMDVDSTGVYVLDSNSRKVIRYSHDGTFINESKLSFLADAFKHLQNGNFIFNITPDGKASPSLCITDSSGHILTFFCYYEDGYFGGSTTNNVFRETSDGIFYYRSPSDTLIKMDENGNVISRLFFDFMGKGISQIAKKDFLAFRRNEKNKSYLRLVDTPFFLSGSLLIGLVEDEKSLYTIICDPVNNMCGSRKFTSNSSVYDIIEPLTSVGDSAVVSLMNEELAYRCRDYATLPDSIKDSLKSGARILVLNTLN